MKKLSFIAIISAGLLWGTSCLFADGLGEYGFTSLQMTAIRSTVAALCILLYALVFDRKLFKVSKKMFIMLAFSGVTFYVSAACYYTAMQMTSAATSAVIMYTAPVMVMIYSVIFMGEKFTPIKAIAIVLMVIGCCFVSGIFESTNFNIIGVLLALLSGIMYAAYSILSKIEMKAGCNPLTATLYSAIFMSLSSLVVANPVDIVKTAGASESILPVILLAIGLGLCTFTLPSALFNLGMKNLPAGIGSALSIVEPMSATVYAMLFLNQIPTVLSFVGIFMIFTVVYLLSLNDESKTMTRKKVAEQVSKKH